MSREDIRNAGLAALYFGGSTAITWWFIEAGAPLYDNKGRMFLSCAIAGAKWTLQIGAALLFLRKARWDFIRNIGSVCFTGSCILLPFCFGPVQQVLGQKGFLCSLVLCVVTMIILYYLSVRRSGISLRWFWGWILCLLIAIALQLTVVFHVIG